MLVVDWRRTIRGARDGESVDLASLMAPRTPSADPGDTASVSEPGARRELMAEEERLWSAIHHQIDSLPPGKVDEPGYFVEGWSAKDLVAHIGSWLAEAGVVLERIRAGTYRPEEIDVDRMNEEFYKALYDVPFHDVRAQALTARAQMLRAWSSLPEPSREADRWISKSGPEHYQQHLPRLEAWVLELSR
jgi:hypothetical protein